MLIMKKLLNTFAICAMVLAFSSCQDWITEPSPGATTVSDFYTSSTAAVQNVNAAYVPLMWEFNSTYFPEWFIGDVVSDDALKGGQYVKTDMGDVYDMENFKTNTNNTFLLEFYRAQFQGVQRCNLVLKYVPNMDDALFADAPVGLKQRVIAEAKFLRAMYYFRLVRVFGGVPLVLEPLTTDDQWHQDRATIDQVYAQIIADLEDAEKDLWKKSDTRFTLKDLGRATQGAAQAMLLKVNLYQHNYEVARSWGDKVIQSGEYDLCANYADNFTLEGENGVESVFEIQYMQDPNSDYGEGYGFTRGTFSVVLTRSRSEFFAGKTGWGFNKPTNNLYNEFEEGDPRRDITIWNPTDDQITNPSEEIYLGTRLCSRKYALYNETTTDCYTLTHATRGPINNKVIRYADVLLMYAEACEQAGAGVSGDAQWALEEVRARARANAADASALPAYPNYTITINGTEINPTLQEAIRHERRVELAMEGHRWFDLCRWGVAKATMDAYIATESAEAQAEYGQFIEGKNELFPIPSQEIDLNEMTQNPMY